jgi:hypothetical protein
MKLSKLPGVSLLLVGLVLMFILRPIVGGIPAIGGLLQTMAFVVGGLGIVGGGYLVARALTGMGR